jgi:hypothetical protein
VIFAALVFIRLRSYDENKVATPPAETARATTATEAIRAPEDPGVLVDVPSADSSGTVAGTSTATPLGATARQQRYNELLRTPPPGAGQPAATGGPARSVEGQPRSASPAGDTTSTSGGPVARPAPAPAPTPARAQPPQQPQRPKPVEPDPDPDDAYPGPEDNDDPESDTAPPTLLSAEFTPSQVNDGDTTLFAAMVTDNLSGVRSVSGVIATASGGVQGFACQREGDSNRFVARVTVPADAAEGVWAVKYLTLSDNAGNSVNLNAGQGTLPASARFQVTSTRSDAKGPQLRSIRLERPVMSAGERNNVFIEADDDTAGVHLVSGSFISPTRQARIGFGCRAGSTGVWECALSPPACLDCGTWQLEQIQLQDKASNMTTFRSDHAVVSAVRLDISGDRCDGNPPALASLALDPMVVSNAEPSTIRVGVTLADEVCGGSSVSGQAVGPAGPSGARLYLSFDPSADGKNFAGKIVVPKHAPKGVWTIAWVQVLDKGMNLRAYPANDPILSRVSFRVE